MTLFSLSSLEPDSWSAAVSRNFSVLVADGRIVSGEVLVVVIVMPVEAIGTPVAVMVEVDGYTAV